VYYVLSSVEEITGEMKRLILKCRALETKLEQSVPKKAYQDAVAKLQANIDKLTEDLQRTRDDLGRTESLGGRLNNLSTVVLTLSNQISAQNDVIKGLTEKYQVPQDLHNKALSKIKDLEQSISKKASDSEAARARIAELETKLSETVPKEKYTKLMDQISGLVSFTGENSLLTEPQADQHEIPGDTVLNSFPTAQAGQEILSQLPEIQATEKVETTGA
jgi:chromosome segregation ATPase